MADCAKIMGASALYGNVYKYHIYYSIMDILLTPEQRTRALYAHRISAIVGELRSQYPVIWQDISVDDGRLVNATPMQIKRLQDVLRHELRDPEITVGTVRMPMRAITPLPCAQQSLLKLTRDILDEQLYSRGVRRSGGAYFRRTMDTGERRIR